MSDAIEVTAKVRYRKWNAPNFATVDLPPRPKQDGIQALPSTPVAELEPEVLQALAEAWLTDLCDKAGRSAPRIQW